MPPENPSGELSSFLTSGIYHLDGSKIIFVDPVRLLNRSYSRFRVSPSSYYARTFQSLTKAKPSGQSTSKKRKRKKPRSHDLNEREISAENRHQGIRPLLVNAHEALLRAGELLWLIPKLVEEDEEILKEGKEGEQNFIELGSLWQAPLYEISLCFGRRDREEGSCIDHHSESIAVPVFNNLVRNETADDVEAHFLSMRYILPSRSSFYMSDLRKIHDLVPAQSDHGFNLIVIDPPWENGSVNQKAAYPTLPNRYFLYLPVKQLAHTEGALVVLWVTNREKLHKFVEKELFPAWGVTNVTVFHWLKVKPDGTLLGELDLFHHRPYEILLVGYVNEKRVNSECQQAFTFLQSNQVIISIPGAHSRKPPLGKILLDHIPGPKPARCIELFARELVSGWTSWGNEPLHFQDLRYFAKKKGF